MNVIFRINKVIFLSIFILLSSCKIIDVDEEKNYLINLSSVGGITSYKGIPYTGKMVKYVDDEKTQLKWEKTYKEGKLKGLSEEYNRDGQLKSRRTYKEDKLNGLYETYYENGQLEYRGTYKDGKEDGQWELYDENGKFVEKVRFIDGVKQDD